MTISAYAVTDVISGCILATFKIAMALVIYKILLLRSYRIILKENFKYVIGPGIAKVNIIKIGMPFRGFTQAIILSWVRPLIYTASFLLLIE